MRISWIFVALVLVHLAIVQAQDETGAAPSDSAPIGGSLVSGSASASRSGKRHESSALASNLDVFGESGLGPLPDPLSLGATPGSSSMAALGNTLPPFMSAQSGVAPNIIVDAHQQASLDLDKRIKSVEDLLNRMVWQLNRETSWANSVHDIIQNYQYKYTKVLSNIKSHTERASQMRDLLSQLKKARLHEVLEADLAKATRELNELASSSSETSGDEGSYAALKDRISLMKQDLEKMSKTKVNKVLSAAQDKLKSASEKAVPPPSSDTLKPLLK